MRYGDRMEVRCCCVPEKLLGWLYWPDRSQVVMRFTLLDKIPYDPSVRAAPLKSCAEFVELTIDHYYPEPGICREAIKADGVPIEKLRKIRGFVENRL